MRHTVASSLRGSLFTKDNHGEFLIVKIARLICIIDIEQRLNLLFGVLETNFGEYLHEFWESNMPTAMNIKEFEHLDEMSFFTDFGGRFLQELGS
jgi:hypothetical protein